MIEIEQHDNANTQYQALDTTLRNSHFDGSAAQAHGIACGLVCRNVQSADLTPIIEHLNFTDDSSIMALEGLLELSATDLNQAEFSFDLWLPEVDELNLQMDALADWAQGFIIVLMHDGNAFVANLSEELQGSVEDIIQIAGLEAAYDTSGEDEVAFMELKRIFAHGHSAHL